MVRVFEYFVRGSVIETVRERYGVSMGSTRFSFERVFDGIW